MIVFIAGPVRSGKSTFALDVARKSGHTPVYVATYEVDPRDPEMAERIARHRAERGIMRTVETNEQSGPSLAQTLAAAPAGEILIVDSLGTWLGAHLHALEELALVDSLAAARQLERRAATLVSVLDGLAADVVIVSEEAGWGVVPPTVLGRLFRDQLGRLAADIASRADRAYLVVAGFAVDLAATGRRISG
jgi:adenosylcobinamide kinase/adenosylcobinamide-phosphate guanylyltransferase